MGRVSGKVAIITGAAKGLGEADARMLAREGAKVILTDVDEANGVRVAAEIGASARFVKQDVRDEEGWKALIADVMAKEGRLDILVNNAGVVEVGTIETCTYEDWRFVMDVSADGTFFGCKYAIPAMKQSGGGSIINMASVACLQGYPSVTAYAAAKGAVEGMTRAIAVHCTQNKLNIRCNSIHPGTIDTPMVASMVPKSAAAGTPMNTDGPRPILGHPDDIANTVLFLASDESRFINGTQIAVDNTSTVTPGFVPA
jgi:3(or 17)beta-hydroxysteroid dehydrogenase